ncbi:hypothetical protein ACB092_11G000600 [Castanea dentata]
MLRMASQNDVKETSETETTNSVMEKENAARKGITRPPLNFLPILKEAGIPIEISSPDKLCERLYQGVFVEGNKKKFYVDKNLNKNGYVLFPKALYICWGDTPKYWKWNTEKDMSGEDIQVAELLNVCWLEIRSSFRTITLTPGTQYEIVFVIMIKEFNNMSNCELLLTIHPPKEKAVSRRQYLKEYPLNKWVEMQVGVFWMKPENVGGLSFSLEEYSSFWKKGLVVKCVFIRPKN